MFLGHMGLRRLWFRALCGVFCRKQWWDTYKKTLDKVDDDMTKQMDIIQLIRRLRAHGFALSMMYEKSTLHKISQKSKGKPFESEDDTDKIIVDDTTNLWGAHEMFSKDEKKAIAKDEQESDTADHINQRALRQLVAANIGNEEE